MFPRNFLRFDFSRSNQHTNYVTDSYFLIGRRGEKSRSGSNGSERRKQSTSRDCRKANDRSFCKSKSRGTIQNLRKSFGDNWLYYFRPKVRHYITIDIK